MQKSWERTLISCGHCPASLLGRNLLLSNIFLMMLFRSMAPSSLLQKLSTTIKLHAEGREPCTNQQHITSKNKYLVPRLRRAFFRDAHNDGTTWVQNWRPERGDAARQEKLSSLTGWDTISRAETHFCSVDFVLYGSRQAHATSNSEVIWNPLHFFWWIRPDWHGP